jgi:hypothetical protein
MDATGIKQLNIKQLNTDEVSALERLYFKGCVIGQIQYNADEMLDLIRCVQALIADRSDLCIVFRLALIENLPIIFKDGHILIVASD